MSTLPQATELGTHLVERVFVMENHDEAYHIWRRANVTDRILVHIDAHHDMWWIPDDAPVTIANFICPAIKSNLVREVIWVVPDPAWTSKESRKAVLRHVEKIEKTYPGANYRANVGPTGISTQVAGKRLKVCPLRFLSEIAEIVLLDIDIDFLMIPRVTYGKKHDAQQSLPWCWPEELVGRLGACRIQSDLVTIAYSVEGGYTPLTCKYFGDEVALRLKAADDDDPVIAGMNLLRQGTVAASDQNGPESENRFLEADRLMPGSAAPSYQLAHLYARMGRVDEGRRWYQRALALDPSYRTPFNSVGLLHFQDGHVRQAEKEHRRTLDLDPHDAYAHLGLGLIALRRKRWKDAEASLREAIKLDSTLLDAHRALGQLLAKQGKRREAILANESAMRLALAGYRPLNVPILTGGADNRYPGAASTYEDLASQYVLKAFMRAINARRSS